MRRARGPGLLALALAGLSGCREAPEPAPPPLEEMVATPGDWSALARAVGLTPGRSLLLGKGPIVTDFHALAGPDAALVRERLHARGGPLVEEEGLLVSATPPGADAAYLVIDRDEHALLVGWAGAGGWQERRTAGADIARPASIARLRGD